MLESIKKMLDCFEKYNIQYCHWKSNEHLEEALLGNTDLDVLFKPEQRDLLERALSEAGLKRFRATPLMQYNAIEDYIGFDVKEAKIWHLHLHYRLSLGEKHLKGYTLPWTDYILNSRRLYVENNDKIYCSSLEVEYLLLLVRISLKLRWRDYGKKLGKDDIQEITWLKERCKIEDVEKVACELLKTKDVEIIRKLLKEDLKNKNQFFCLQKTLRKSMSVYTHYNKVSSFLVREKRELFWLIGGVKRRLGMSSTVANRRISPSGGTVVAFLGCDGAGKSTTLFYVKKEFNKKIDVYSTYLGSGDGSSSLLRKPMKLVAKKVGGKGVGHKVEKEINSGGKISLKSRLYSFAKVIWAVTLAQEKKKKLNKITKARNNGLLVLVDRYPQVEVPGYSDGPLLVKYRSSKGLMKKIADWEYDVYESAYENAPDLLLKLMVPTEVAISRKPEMTAEEIDNKKAAVMKMNFSENCIIVDTSVQLVKSLGVVMNEIWKRI